MMIRLLFYLVVLVLAVCSAWTSIELIQQHAQRDRGFFHLIVTLVLLIAATRLWRNRNRPLKSDESRRPVYLLFYFIGFILFTSIDWTFDNGFPGKAWEHLLFAMLMVTAGYEQWKRGKLSRTTVKHDLE